MERALPGLSVRALSASLNLPVSVVFNVGIMLIKLSKLTFENRNARMFMSPRRSPTQGPQYRAGGGGAVDGDLSID